MITRGRLHEIIKKITHYHSSLPFISFANFTFAQEKSMEEVVITATFRETNAMDTPMSVDAIGEDSMEQLSAESLEDIFRSSTGLNIFSGIQVSRIIIRELLTLKI